MGITQPRALLLADPCHHITSKLSENANYLSIAVSLLNLSAGHSSCGHVGFAVCSDQSA